ncbi:putative WRKY transcription factor 19 [Morella rubra]|uniref:Putative WRKY transcription factor 19 n=1 Tax=Morella rubra TaxID=262757 RepID=A0A6A1WR44_9ROSI|nr:putative WRKY transcription factor 19 [Morella rubra]
MPTKELRLMNWSGFPFKYLPMDFNPDNLVELKMRGSSVKQLWKGNKGTSSVSTKVMHGSLFTSDGIPEWFSNTSRGTSDITLVHDLDNNRKWIGYSMFIDYEVIQLPGGVQRYRDYRELVETTYNWVPEYKKYEDDLSVVISSGCFGRMVDLIFHQLKAYIFALLHSGIVGINEGEFGLIYQLGGLWNSSWIWID